MRMQSAWRRGKRGRTCRIRRWVSRRKRWCRGSSSWFMGLRTRHDLQMGRFSRRAGQNDQSSSEMIEDEHRNRASAIGGCMTDTKALIEQAYSAFNKRDIHGVLALMTENVSWPKASEGGRVVGKEEIRAYWTRQWGEFDGHVEPLAITEEDLGRIRVR